MTAELVHGYFVHGVSDGSWLVSLDENANAVLGQVYPVGAWWVALRSDIPLTELFPENIESLSLEDLVLFETELLRRASTYRHGPNIAGWAHSRDDAIAVFGSPEAEAPGAIVEA